MCVDCVRWTVRVMQLRIDASIIHLVRKSIPLIGRALKSIKGFVFRKKFINLQKNSLILALCLQPYTKKVIKIIVGFLLTLLDPPEV